MAANFHEQFDEAKVERPSDRSTGLVFAVVCLIVAAIYYKHTTTLTVSLSIAALLALISYTLPVLLRPLNIFWFNVGLLLHKVVNPLIMGVLFFLVITPFGFLMRLGYDPLRARIASHVPSFWVKREARHADGVSVQSMKNQF